MQNGKRFAFDARKRLPWSPCEGVEFQLVEPSRGDVIRLTEQVAGDDTDRMMAFLRHALRDQDGRQVIPDIEAQQEFLDHLGISAFNDLIDRLNEVMGGRPGNSTASAGPPSA
jgi:hypothetical protein